MYAYNPGQVLMSSTTSYKQPSSQMGPYNSMSVGQNPQKYHPQYVNSSNPHPQYGNYTASTMAGHQIHGQMPSPSNTYQVQTPYGHQYGGYQSAFKENKVLYWKKVFNKEKETIILKQKEKQENRKVLIK